MYCEKQCSNVRELLCCWVESKMRLYRIVLLVWCVDKYIFCVCFFSGFSFVLSNSTLYKSLFYGSLVFIHFDSLTNCYQQFHFICTYFFVFFFDFFFSFFSTLFRFSHWNWFSVIVIMHDITWQSIIWWTLYEFDVVSYFKFFKSTKYEHFFSQTFWIHLPDIMHLHQCNFFFIYSWIHMFAAHSKAWEQLKPVIMILSIDNVEKK